MPGIRLVRNLTLVVLLYETTLFTDLYLQAIGEVEGTFFIQIQILIIFYAMYLIIKKKKIFLQAKFNKMFTFF